MCIVLNPDVIKGSFRKKLNQNFYIISNEKKKRMYDHLSLLNTPLGFFIECIVHRVKYRGKILCIYIPSNNK